MNRRIGPAIALLVAVLLASWTFRTTKARYDELRPGWSWDLAFFNQSFWAMTKGDGVLTVRPSAAFADEGPSVWKMNHLSPLRVALAPIYAIWPSPTTILFFQAAIFWLVIPAAYTLARSESGSTGFAIAATALVPMTPLIWPLAINDFRELQLAIPFAIWAVDGVRGRKLGISAIGIGGMLASRQEYALAVAMLPLLPPRLAEDPGRTFRWTWVLLFLGLVWMLWIYLGYLKYSAGRGSPEAYLAQFEGARPTLAQTLSTGSEFVFLGLGSWAILMLFVPRAALLPLPWIWSLSSGRWALGYIATEQWHHVRYTSPIVAFGLAAGLIGYARFWTLVSRTSRPILWQTLAWLLIAAGLLVPKAVLDRRLDEVPTAISKTEAAAIWPWINQVKPTDGVVTAYEVSAPLSSRRLLFANRLDQNKPKGYPDHLDRAIRWAFIRAGDLPDGVLESQGFAKVHQGKFLVIFRRD